MRRRHGRADTIPSPSRSTVRRALQRCGCRCRAAGAPVLLAAASGTTSTDGSGRRPASPPGAPAQHPSRPVAGVGITLGTEVPGPSCSTIAAVRLSDRAPRSAAASGRPAPVMTRSGRGRLRSAPDHPGRQAPRTQSGSVTDVVIPTGSDLDGASLATASPTAGTAQFATLPPPTAPPGRRPRAPRVGRRRGVGPPRGDPSRRR